MSVNNNNVPVVLSYSASDHFDCYIAAISHEYGPLILDAYLIICNMAWKVTPVDGSITYLCHTYITP